MREFIFGYEEEHGELQALAENNVQWKTLLMLQILTTIFGVEVSLFPVVLDACGALSTYHHVIFLSIVSRDIILYLENAYFQKTSGSTHVAKNTRFFWSIAGQELSVSLKIQ